MRLICRPLSVLLCAVLVAGSTTQAQSLDPAAKSETQELQLRVVDAGQEHTGPQALTVIVTDDRNAPVANAAVLFRLPAEPPAATFSDGSHVAVAYTDMEGRATSGVIQWGQSSGPVAIRITATKGTAHAGLLLEQTPTANKPIAERSAELPRQPGQPAPAQEPSTGEQGLASPPVQSSSPVRPADSSPAPETVSTHPTVTINTHPSRQVTGASGHSKKWLWVGLAAAAGAGATLALAGGKSSGSSASIQGSTTVGNPNVIIGHP